MPNSLFQEMLRLLDDALIDVTLSQKFSDDSRKMRAINTIATARSMQLEVAELMDKVYPEVDCTCPVRRAGPDGCPTCPNIESCESRAMKRMFIEGTITRAIDTAPDDALSPPAYIVEIRKAPANKRVCLSEGCGHLPANENGSGPKKIDPKKTWQI